VLISKTKIEGEEALRRLVLALNGLAGIAFIEKKSDQAVSLYKEALGFAEENYEDFRLDPLMNIHVLHNLAEVRPLTTNCSDRCPQNDQQLRKVSKRKGTETCGLDVAKRRKVSGEDKFATDAGLPQDNAPDLKEDSLIANRKSDDLGNASCSSCCRESLRNACENIKQKYLSAFTSRLSSAQEEFRKSYKQVYNLHSYNMTHKNCMWHGVYIMLSTEKKIISFIYDIVHIILTV